MLRRLVLGCGTVGRAVVESAADWSGTIRVVTDGPRQAESLREENIAAIEADPTDPSVFPESADVVMILGDDPEMNLAAATAARSRFPEALVVGYAGQDPERSTRDELASLVDRLIVPDAILGQQVLSVATDSRARRLQKLLQVLRDLDGSLAVVTHDNPDPDAIASALALTRIAESVGVDAQPCYFGDISHQENRALVNLLNLRLRNLPPEFDVASEYDGIALVDHSRPGVNDGLDPETVVDIVIDHHPPRAPVEASFVDLRSSVGATSTLMTDYMERLNITPDRTVATALLFGIRVDTNDFVREVSVTDFEAAAFLLPYADSGLLERVESPSVSPDVLETIGSAIRNREIRGRAVAASVGEIRNRDALAQAAEQLLDMEGVRVTLVYGFGEGTVYASARARGTEVDVGEALREAYGQMGSAGGHADMAGAQIPLGILDHVDDDSRESLSEVVRKVMNERFFETLETAPSTPDAGRDDDITFEFPLED
jgi:nanoRNase/pAp phosphatase (c-di-AMP/oligoRNAs hydrolase)